MADQGAERQLVVFDLAGEVYGVNIETVREIIRMQDVTYVPDAPEFVEGVINLRGRVIPVVDLRKRFSLTQSEATEESRVVVVDIGGEDIGVIVDAVTEVLRIAVDSIESTSSLVTTEDSYYLEGIVEVDDGLLILLDIEQALAQGVEEMPELADVPA
jgi:purine-binding chemotaxis protein CheW